MECTGWSWATAATPFCFIAMTPEQFTQMMEALDAHTEALHGLAYAQLWCMGLLIVVILSPMLRFDRQ